MKRILVAVMITLGLSANAQNELPKTASEIAPLLIGEKIPNLTLKSSEGIDVNLETLFIKQKTILVFYRGGWCPYCNVHLAALGEAEKELLNLGYQIVAVSPDSPKNLKVSDEKEKLNYLLLSDSNGNLAKAAGIAFQAPDNYKPYISGASEGTNASFLPVPTVFIINKNSEIQFEHINPNYKERISNELIISVAKSLK